MRPKWPIRNIGKLGEGGGVRLTIGQRNARMPKDYKFAVVRWRKQQGLSPEEAAIRSEVSLRTWQRYESRTPELNHGTMKVWPVPFWLRGYIDRGQPLEGK